MRDQHKKIKGYRDLSQDEIDTMNMIKETGESLKELIDVVSASSGVDHRWVALAQTDLQKGIMALVRSVAKPESF